MSVQPNLKLGDKYFDENQTVTTDNITKIVGITQFNIDIFNLPYYAQRCHVDINLVYRH